MGLIDTARQGFAPVEAKQEAKDQALQHLQRWLDGEEFAAYKPQIEWQINAGHFSALLDQFYQVLPFGTGGRRGAVGIGPNRMNPWTLAASVQGHCDYLKERFPGSAKPLQVVIAFDVRGFKDNRKVYHPDLPNPVLNLTSRDFAQLAACVYVANGIEVHITPPESDRYLATPELSFTIRHLGAHGGLNVSASHNPSDDNGGKFYDERGGQPVPPDDQIMSDMVEQVTLIRSIPWEDAMRGGKIHWLDDSTHRAYIELLRKQSLIDPPRVDEFRVVFTPLHGVGHMTAMELLEAQGFRPIPVEGQMSPDGQFPNVTELPNPEVPVSLDRAEETASREQADLLMATDPDADRLGGMASTTSAGGGKFQYLTGNQIAALLTHFKFNQLRKSGRLPNSPVLITTEVTTSLVTVIARDFNAGIVNNLMVGFKYIADVLHHLETNGRYEDVTGSVNDFVIGTEESHGYLLTSEIRDKDAAGPALLLAELALDRKRHSSTVVEYLDELHRRYGYYCNRTMNIKMPGIEGRENMMRMLDGLRETPPTTIGGLTVREVEDLRDESGRLGVFKGNTDYLSRNFLIYRLDGPGELTAKVTLRPSGTEPKAKAYVEVGGVKCPVGTSDDQWIQMCKEVDDLNDKVGRDFLRQAGVPDAS